MSRARKLLNVICMMLCILLLAGSAGQQVHATANNNILPMRRHKTIHFLCTIFCKINVSIFSPT